MPKVVWDEGMIETVLRMRKERSPLDKCAERVGVSYPTCVKKARELGCNERMNHGNRSGPKVHAAQQSAAQ
jgi:hypothetical protein